MDSETRSHLGLTLIVTSVAFVDVMLYVAFWDSFSITTYTTIKPIKQALFLILILRLILIMILKLRLILNKQDLRVTYDGGGGMHDMHEVQTPFHTK